MRVCILSFCLSVCVSVNGSQSVGVTCFVFIIRWFVVDILWNRAQIQSLELKVKQLQQDLTESYRLKSENITQVLRLKEQVELLEKKLLAKDQEWVLHCILLCIVLVCVCVCVSFSKAALVLCTTLDGFFFQNSLWLSQCAFRMEAKRNEFEKYISVHRFLLEFSHSFSLSLSVCLSHLFLSPMFCIGRRLKCPSV